jgi:hypothetical protein
VPAGAVALGAWKRRLDEQQIGVSGEAHQIVVGTTVGAVGEARSGAGQFDGEGGDVVWNLAEAHLQRTE